MDRNFWIERWRAHDIGFHQPEFEPALDRFWPGLDIERGTRVFVPLCGKSLDMLWFAQQGYGVVGAELSEQAVNEFFAEREVSPEVRRVGDFVVKSWGPYEIWCGDFFELPASALADVVAVYDRAALIALPAELQPRYAEKMKAVLPENTPIMLITIDYDQREMSGPPFATSPARVDELFSDRYTRSELTSKDVLAGHPHFVQRGLTALTGAVSLLRPR